MPAFKIDTFGGMIPAVDDRLIPDKAAAYAENVWLYSGSLTGRPQPQLLRTCTIPGTGKVFRIPNNYVDSIHFGDSDWLEFTDIDTDVIRGLTIDDDYDRYYWCAPTIAPRYNTRARIKSGSASYLLGVPQPGTATTVTSSGGTGVATSRAYTYTFVSAFGEEGPPATPATRNGKIDDSWTVTYASPTVDEAANRSLTKTRIYRTVTSSAGVATYFLVAELPVGGSTYVDTKSDTVVSLSSELESTGWTAPPSDLRGWVTLPNGMIAGFRANEVWYCEPFRPHAWPAAYVNLTDFPIVGIAASGTALVVLTEGNPYIATGAHPSAVTFTKLPVNAPCLSRGSIVSAPDGVRFASTNGLMLIAAGQATNLTQQFLSPNKWRQIASLPTLRAAMLGTAYYAYGSAREGVFLTTAFNTSAFAQQDYAGAFTGFMFEITDPRVGYSVLSEYSAPTTNIVPDIWSGETFVIRNNSVYWINIADAAPVRKSYLWRSKQYQSSLLRNYEAMRIYFSVPPNTPAQNPVRNTDLVQTLQNDQYGLVRFYADGVLKMTRELRTSGELMRMPSGFKYDYFQLEIEARVEVYSIQAATSAKELAVA